MQVLVADDDPVYRNLLKGVLSQWGVEVSLASDGAEAWAILQRPNAPEIVLLDWMMPGMDGFEVCRKIRQAKGSQDIYVVLMTANSCRDEITKVLVAGADDYLLKPFEPLDLKIRLRTGARILALEKQVRCPQASGVALG